MSNKAWPTQLGALVSRATLGENGWLGFTPLPISVTGGGFLGQREPLPAGEADTDGYDNYGLSGLSANSSPHSRPASSSLKIQATCLHVSRPRGY